MVYWEKSCCANFLLEEFDYVYVDAYELSFPNCLKYRHFWTLKICTTDTGSFLGG